MERTLSRVWRRLCEAMTSQRYRREMGRHLMQLIEQGRTGSRDHELPATDPKRP